MKNSDKITFVLGSAFVAIGFIMMGSNIRLDLIVPVFLAMIVGSAMMGYSLAQKYN